MNATEWTINDIKSAVRATGSHWFDPDTMRFFGTKIVGSAVYQGEGGIYFVTSEWDGFSGRENNKRAFSVRQFTPDNAEIDTVGDVCQYQNATDAMTEAKRLAASGAVVVCEDFAPISESEQFLHDCRKHGNPETEAKTARRLMQLAYDHHKLMEQQCNGHVDNVRLNNVKRSIKSAASKAGAVRVVLSGDPRGATVKLVWPNGECNDWGKEGWIVPKWEGE